ncbi:MAG: TonB-dependent receptor [Flavobacteriaceae bacterium]|nr:TonB-dependent receptor [Flavobacteriaceae bacterium]
MVKKVLSATLALASVVAFAQSVVKGEVKDTFGNAIPNATVSVEGTEITATTDNEGKFSVELPAGKGTLSFSAKDFKPFKRSVSADVPVVYITMQDGSKEISELVISAHKKLEVNKLNIKNIEAPMTVNVLNNATLKTWDVNTIEDASRLVAGVNAYRQYGGFQGFTLRGFKDFVVLYDGMRDERHSMFDTAPMSNLANIERVEVLKGPSGDMFGHSALGGIINIVRKRPTYTTKGDAKFTIGSYNTYNAVVGVGGPISEQLRYRIDGATLNGDGFKGVKETYANLSAMLEYTPDDRNTLEFFYQYNDNYFGSDTGVPADDNGKPLFDPMINFANPSDYLKHKRHEAYIKYKHRFLDNSLLNYKISYGYDDYKFLLDEVLFVQDGKVSRRNFGGAYFNRLDKSIVSQLDYTFKFNTGDIAHKTIIGNTVSILNKPNVFSFANIKVSENDADLINNGGKGEKRIAMIDRHQQLKENTISFYLQDWIQFTDRFKALVGLRYDYLSGEYAPRVETTKPLDFTKASVGNFTYRGALSYQIVKDFLMTYASASSYFKPNRSHNHRTGQYFKPEKGFQAEGGFKLETKNKVNATISGFYIQKNNLTVGHNVITQVGKAISTGVEIDADAEITKGLYAKVGYAYTNAYFAKQNPEPGKQDISYNKTPFSPKHSLSAWLNYEPEFVKGFGIGAGVFYSDKTYQTQFNDQVLPAYTLVNGMVYYQTKNNVRIGLNVENLFNALYYRGALSSNDLWNMDDPKQAPVDGPYQAQFQVAPGRDRNYKLTISYSF